FDKRPSLRGIHFDDALVWFQVASDMRLTRVCAPAGEAHHDQGDADSSAREQRDRQWTDEDDVAQEFLPVKVECLLTKQGAPHRSSLSAPPGVLAAPGQKACVPACPCLCASMMDEAVGEQAITPRVHILVLIYSVLYIIDTPA